MAQLIERAQIINALKTALEPQPFALAMWEGGAASFGRIDEWSDLDLQVAADDEHVGEIFPIVEHALASLSPIDLKYELPQPAWHGHAQTFYRLRDASPYLMIDFVAMKASAPEKFLQSEIHGNAVVHFDKANLVRAQPLDHVAFEAKLRDRVETLRVTFDLFQPLTLKELNRGNDIEAIAFYQSWVLRPLVELLRIQHAPFHSNFHARYVHYDLPEPIVEKLQPLFYIRDVHDLCAKREQAEKWFHEILEESGRK